MTVAEQLQKKKQIKVEVAEELKETCWLDERVSEGQRKPKRKKKSVTENQNWDVYDRLMARGRVG